MPHSPEPLLEVRAGEAADLAYIAWALGDRHIPAQLSAEWLRVRPDPVVEALLQSAHAAFVTVEAPFEPEGGAYAHGHASHDHAHHTHKHND